MKGRSSTPPPVITLPTLDDLPRFVKSDTTTTDGNVLKVWADEIISSFDSDELQLRWDAYISDDSDSRNGDDMILLDANDITMVTPINNYILGVDLTSLQPNRGYTFRLNAFDPLNQHGYADVTLSMNNPPR